MENTVEIKKPAKIVITHRSIMGALASCAVQQSPYHRPDNLEVVLDKFHEQIKDQFGGYIMKFDSVKSIREWLEPKLKSIPEFMLWNERKNGNQAPYGFAGAGHHDNGDVTFFTTKADNDFIDLDALIRNVINLADND